MPALPDIVRELIAVTTPISLEVEESNGVLIKGFASVEAVDRSGDVVPPEEFNIKQFMAAPAIMVNHKFWIDPQGNEVTVGKPVSLNAVTLAKNEDESLWSIVNEIGEVINTFPKEKVPNLKAGDRGLFIVAKITEESLIERVKRGEFAAFSWRGLASVDFRINKNHELERVLTDIDLFEISLVSVPDNPNATFTLGKSAHIVKLSKGRFDQSSAVNYLKEHRLNVDHIMEDEDSYYSRQLTSDYFDLEKLVLMKMADGVHVIAGDAKIELPVQSIAQSKADSLSKEDAWPWSWLSKESIDKFTSSKVKLFGELEMSDQDKKPEEKAEETKEVEEIKEEKEKEVEEEKDTNIAAMVEFQEAIAAKTAEALTPLFEGLTASNQAIVEILTKAFEKREEKVEEKEEEKKSTEVWDKLNVMAEVVKNLQTQLVDVAKSASEAEERAEALAKSTPDEIERSEKVETAKSKSNDPNAVFDSLFPFLR